jgi:electron transport complex protein RnfE
LFHALSAAVAAGCAHYGLGVIAPALQESMRWYIALMAMNCLVLSHAEQIGARTSVAIAARDALRVAVAVILTTGVLAGIREVASTGALFGDYAMLFSAAATPPALGGMHLTRLAFPVFAKPAGGLLALGLLVALHRAVIRHWRRSD